MTAPVRGIDVVMERFEFDFALPLSLPLRFLGIRPGSAHVDVHDEHLEVVFGPWQLRTALSNVEDTEVTGPYSAVKAYGVRLSLSDLGVTFGTNASRGLCIRFREPVAAALPGGLLRHPSLTVTVEAPQALQRALRERARRPRPLLDAVSSEDVPDVPVIEPDEDRRARERTVRRARKAARTRAENRRAAEAEEQRQAERRSEAARRGAAKRAAAAQQAEKRAEKRAAERAEAAQERTAEGAEKRTATKRAGTKRTATKRTPAKRTTAERPAAKRATTKRAAAERTPAQRASSEQTDTPSATQSSSAERSAETASA